MVWTALVALWACGGADAIDTEPVLETGEVWEWNEEEEPLVEPKPGEWETSAFANAEDTCNFEEVGVDLLVMAPAEHVLELGAELGDFSLANEEHEAYSACTVRGSNFACERVDVPYQHPFGDNISMAFTWSGFAERGRLTGLMEVELVCERDCDFFETVGLTFPCTVTGEAELSLLD